MNLSALIPSRRVPSVTTLWGHRVLAGVLVLPMLLGALVVWSLGDRAENVAQVPAAVVNLDKPILKKGEQPIAAGRLLSAGLTSPTSEEEQSLGWELTDPGTAAAGLRDGDYYAVLVVPRDFSRTLSKAVKGTDVQRATIEVTTDDSSSPLAAQISQQVSKVAADRLGEQVTSTYLDTVFSGTDKLADQLEKAADGADRLADGTERLRQGTDQFAGGLTRLGAGATRLASGAQRLADGGDRLASGSRRLAAGTGRLADGLGTLERRTDPLPRQTDRLADGARKVSRGVTAYSKLLEGWAQACTDPLVAARATRLCLLTQRAVGPGGSNAERLRSGARQLADGARQLSDAMPRLTGAIDRAAAGADRLAGGADRLADGTRRLATGTRRLADGAARLGSGADRAADGATQLASGSERLGDGSRRLATGLDRGADAIPSYGNQKSGDLADVLAAPVAAKTDQLGDVPDGPTQLAPGTIAFVLWLGAFVTYLLRPALPERLLHRPRSASRIATSGLLPGVLVGAVQAVLLFVTMLVLGVDVAAPVLTLVLMLVAAAGFAALNQALVAAFGRRRGWLAIIAFTGLQAVSLGGIIPLDTAPWPIRVLNAALPMSATANGLVATVLDGPGSTVAAVGVVVAWALVGFAVTTTVARRRQMVDVADLRAAQEEQLVG